jgi:hypothetical protein
MAIPNMFTVRALAKRVLRHKLPLIADATDAGSNMDPGLNTDEKAILDEATRMGFPPKVWQLYKTLDDGALPVLTPGVNAIDPTYYEDFWKLPGYEGTNEQGNALRDRIMHSAVVEEIFIPEEITMHVPFEREARHIAKPSEGARMTGVDEAWKRLASGVGRHGKPAVRLSSVPEGDLYLYGTQIKFLDGAIGGYTVPLESLEGDWAVIGEGFGLYDMMEKLSQVKPGDKVMLDNSDYIAIQYFHRHQVPDGSYEGFRQFLGADGKPVYPQRPALVGPMIAYGGAGSLQSGKFKGKMITVNALMDESALPWQPDWYASRVKEHFGDGTDNHFRLWYTENALHGDDGEEVDKLRLTRYIGTLHQALLDVSAWVEQGIEPAASTRYEIKDGQVIVPSTANQRKGIQPVLDLTVNGGKRAEVKTGEAVALYSEIEVPMGTGQIIEATLHIAGGEYILPLEYLNAEKSKAEVRYAYTFDEPGTHFAVLKVKAQRNGDRDDYFTHIENISRARIVVTE